MKVVEFHVMVMKKDNSYLLFAHIKYLSSLDLASRKITRLLIYVELPFAFPAIILLILGIPMIVAQSIMSRKKIVKMIMTQLIFQLGTSVVYLWNL